MIPGPGAASAAGDRAGRPPPEPARLPLGAILAGGASRRFGAPKALAEVGGLALIRRVADVLRSVVPDPVLITATPELFAPLGLCSRPDARPGGGPLSGLHTALLWAREQQRHGALVVACDLPFLHPELLARLVRRAGEASALAVAPEGGGRFGIEPLCAWYATEALGEVESRLGRGERSMGELLAALNAGRVPLREVHQIGRPEVLFHNVNTQADRLDAERIARAAEEPDAGG